MLLGLGQSIIRKAQLVKGGVLVFFPSYSVMNLARDLWLKDGGILDQMRNQTNKAVHWESQNQNDF